MEKLSIKEQIKIEQIDGKSLTEEDYKKNFDSWEEGIKEGIVSIDLEDEGWEFIESQVKKLCQLDQKHKLPFERCDLLVQAVRDYGETVLKAMTNAHQTLWTIANMTVAKQTAKVNDAEQAEQDAEEAGGQ